MSEPSSFSTNISTFYLKIGACRHGDRCARKHIRPNYSRSVLIQNFCQNPRLCSSNKGKSEEKKEEEALKFDNFIKDVFIECSLKYGTIEDLVVCENDNTHLNGNTYIKFKDEQAAEKCQSDLNNRWFDGRPVYAELSPVRDFSDASCRQHELHECTRGGMCNFMHLKKPSRGLLGGLFRSQRKMLKERGEW